MDSKITHPNIKEARHICASILDTEMDYTSAYTLKGIAIQLLSFLSSDRIQQVFVYLMLVGRGFANISSWRRFLLRIGGFQEFTCRSEC
jgi:hypothetical protein